MTVVGALFFIKGLHGSLLLLGEGEIVVLLFTTVLALGSPLVPALNCSPWYLPPCSPREPGTARR